MLRAGYLRPPKQTWSEFAPVYRIDAAHFPGDLQILRVLRNRFDEVDRERSVFALN